MELNLKDKVIIVTGGARGIGEAISRVLANEGARPFIIGRHKEENESTVRAIKDAGANADYFTAELNNPNECRKAVESVTSRHKRIDGLVNNAGQNDSIGLEKGDYENFMLSLHKNLVHYYLIAHYSLPFLKSTRGPIVNISSKTAETGQGNTSAYAAANGGRNALTREWAVELLPFGIRVNSVVVSESWTPLYESWINTFPDKEAKLHTITSRIPFGNRMTKPEEIANTVAFLLSDKSSHTTGQLVHVDGGYVHLDRAINPS